MDTPKGSLIIPKRCIGGLRKLLWNDASFIYAASVDHTKVLQIAIKTCLGPSQTAHKRPQKTLRRRPATKISPQELLSEPYETTSGTEETSARPKDPLGESQVTLGEQQDAPGAPLDTPKGLPNESKSFPKGSLEAYRSSSGKIYPLFTWILWTLRKYAK